MLITHANMLGRFCDILKWATEIDLATAWATRNSGLRALQDRPTPLEIRAIVGLSGNATHPKALRSLATISQLCTPEVSWNFHPKVYIFRGVDRSIAWIGSANFTRRGFEENEEVLFETSDTKDVEQWFDQLWEHCNPLDKSAIDNYETWWKSNSPQRRHHPATWPPATIDSPPPMELLEGVDDWRSYVAALKQCDWWWKCWSMRHHPENPWSVLGKTNSWRETIRHLHAVVLKDWRNLSDDDQSRLLGLKKDHWALLGGMRVSAKHTVFGRFGEKIQNSIRRVVAARDADFPDVAIEAYASLVDPNMKGIGEGIASRLLALARPDRFVSLNGGSRKGLARCIGPNTPTALGTPKNYRNLLEEIYDRAWFREPAPQDAHEQEISSMRAALLDCFVYKNKAE